ncbi:MAG: hypothetical protein KGQ42_08225 [Alphaproteobacteria bacterium]|nr:hypothetical protein [Alphaproteobacteria bacterium]
MWLRAMGILSALVAVYFYYQDEQLIALLIGIVAAMCTATGWIFKITS